MPCYEYRCNVCDAKEERLEHISDPPPARVCDWCGEGVITRQVGRTSFKLKGSGWAKDGYKSTKGK